MRKERVDEEFIEAILNMTDEEFEDFLSLQDDLNALVADELNRSLAKLQGLLI